MRKVERVTIADEGRDNGKTFVITEMDAWAAIQWATRALLSLTRTGAQLPEGAFEGSPESIAAFGITILALLPPDVALPLMDEARACIQVQPPGGNALILQPIDFGGVSAVEEPKTWITLLRRAFALHVGFSQAAERPTTG